MSSLRIIFMGTPEFAVASLDMLVQHNYNVVAVVTAPDKPAGRGLELQFSDVKKYAIEKGIPVLQPLKLKDENFLQELKAFGADLQVVVAFRMLPEVVWNMPRLGTINLHGSLLPQYRGAAPINRAIMNGEKETGVSTFFLQQEVDTGKIIFREKTPIGESETAGELHDRLMAIGADLMLKTIQAIESGHYPQQDQREFIRAGEPLHGASKIFKEDCRIHWKESAGHIFNFIRGLSPYPAAHTALLSPQGQSFPLKIFRSSKQDAVHSQESGHLLTDGKTYLHIPVSGGYIMLEEVQLAGKKKMGIADFLRGFPLNTSWKVEL
jgi:methionyl-tRNA formyltransferase